ncbi:hypothetical protein ACFYXQ_42605 [Nocardia jiangxiensis]|uniref:Proteins of 100 residues with WXG n=1 Tax=Nocardia jiangxiensis TaxID=282685 RepID=A0ABW6SDS1_9NOCA
MAPDPSLKVDPTVYTAAATECYNLAKDFGTAFDPFYQVLFDSSGMAGDYAQVKTWAGAYDKHVSDFVTMATTFANAVQNMGDLLSYAAYNYASSEYFNTVDVRGDTSNNPPPVQPQVSSPLYGAENPVLIPDSVLGHPGAGITTDIPGLLDHISHPVPNGDTTLLKTAADAWKSFTGNQTVQNASSTLGKISTTLTTDLKAPDLDHFADHFTTLAKGAGDLHSAATDLTPLVTDHHQKLDALRGDISSQTNGLLVELAGIAAAVVVVVVITTIFTAGLGLAGGDEAEVGAGTAAGASAIAAVGEAISTAISGFVAAVLEGAAAAFAGVTALSVTGLAAIAAISVMTVSGDSAESSDDSSDATPKVNDRTGAQDMLNKDATLEKDKDSVIRSKAGGRTEAQREFDEIAEGHEVKTYPNGTKVVRLPDGSDVSLRGSSDGRDTISIQQKGQPDAKYRFNP